MSSRDSVPTLVHFQDPEFAAGFPPPHTTSSSPSSRKRANSSTSDNEEDVDGLPDMAESTLSQGSNASSSTIGALQRGRSVFRPSVSASAPDIRAMGTEEAGVAGGATWRHASGSRTRGVTAPIRDRPSQSRTRSVVFLSVWTMIGLGGRFYKRSSAAISSSVAESAWKVDLASRELQDDMLVKTMQEGMPPLPPDYSLLVGRAAAWMCVCFYLTSRMPQICKGPPFPR